MSTNSSSTAANLAIEPGGQIPALWGCFFVFGNLFAIFWLIRAFLNAHPEVAYQVRVQLARLGLGRGRTKSGKQNSADRQHNSIDDRRLAELAEQGKAAVTAADITAVGSQQPAPASSAVIASRDSIESAGSSKRGPIHSRLSIESTGSARRHHHRHHPQPIICTPSTEVLMAQSPSAASAASLTPRRTFTGANGHAVGLEAVRSDSPEGSIVDADIGSSLSSEDDFRQPVELEWLNMCYSVKVSTGKKYIVQGIYGCAKPGQLQGLMGPSGAGKSTLMDLLAMRTPHDAEAPAAEEPEMTNPSVAPRAVVPLRPLHRSDQSTDSEDSAVATAGLSTVDEDGSNVGGVGNSSLREPPPQLLANGIRMKQRAYMNISAYVPQHDNLVPTMTAYEAVSFYASVILPHGTPKAARQARIARVLRMMGLTEQQHTLVGGFLPGGIMLRGMSGGERKRLAIACGVVAGPSLVFLDEPTSGLDSFAALNVILFLKSMATERGASLLASLHQPRAAIWSQLDQVTLLANGRLMYTGATDDLIPWFTSLGYYYDLQEHGMASDWALDLVALGFTKPHHEHHQDGAEAAEAPAGTDEQQQLQQPQGSVRYRGVGLVPPPSTSTGRQLQRQPSMMSSKSELFEAAEAFLLKLQEQHPVWFSGVYAKSLASAGPTGASASSAYAPTAARVYRSSQGEEEAYSSSSWWRSAKSPKPRSVRIDNQHHAAQQQPQMWDGAVADDAGDADAADQDIEDQQAHHTEQQPQEKLEVAIAQVENAAVVDDVGPFADYQAKRALVAAEPERPNFLNRCLSALHKYRALLWRELLITTRNPADVGGRMMTFTYVAFISGIVSWNLPGGADSMFNRLSVCYAVLTFYFLMPFVFMSIFTSDKRFFAADTTARLYHPAQYYLSKVTVTLPFNIIVAVVFHLIYYGMTGMRHGVQYMAMSCLICVLVGLIGMQAIYCCAVAASSQDLAFVFAIAFTALNLLVNPYMSIFDTYSLGWGFSWLRFFSPCSFAWQALIQVEFGGRGFDCNHGSGLEAIGLITKLMPRPSQYVQGTMTAQQRQLEFISNSLDSLGRFSTGGQCVASGDAIVTMYTMGLTYAEIVGVLLGYFLLFLGLTYLVVARSAKKRLKA